MVNTLTSNLKARGYLLTVFVEATSSGLARDSVILLFQIRTLDKRRLERLLTHFDDPIMEKVDEAIRIAFAI